MATVPFEKMIKFRCYRSSFTHARSLTANPTEFMDDHENEICTSRSKQGSTARPERLRSFVEAQSGYEQALRQAAVDERRALGKNYTRLSGGVCLTAGLLPPANFNVE